MTPTRRSVLAAGALTLATACTGGSPRATPGPEDPDKVLGRAAVVREQDLLTSYDEAAAAVPALAERLAPLRAEHAAHLAALLGPPASGTPSASATPSGSAASATPSTSAPPVPLSRAATRRQLAALERGAAAAHAAAAVKASRRLAPLLASLAASEASHVVVL